MAMLGPLINQVRYIIGRIGKPPAVLRHIVKNPAKKQTLYHCLDVIRDTDRCLESYLETNFNELEVGGKYMHIYGTLHALVMQQDAVKLFARTVEVKYPDDPWLQRIRKYRNQALGHPPKHGPGRSGALHFIKRDSITAAGFELGTIHVKGKSAAFKTVDVSQLIREQRDIFTPVFLRVIHDVRREDM